MAHILAPVVPPPGGNGRSGRMAYDLMSERSRGLPSCLPIAHTSEQEDDIDFGMFEVWFEQDPMPRFVLDPVARVLHANAEGRAVLWPARIGAGASLLCSTHRDRPRLDAAVKSVSQGWQTTARVVVRGQDDAWCLIDLLGAKAFNGQVIATMRRISDLVPERIEPLKAVFGLTPVETQVLMHIVLGYAPKDVGRKLSMSIFTVRTHLRAIFMKLGVRGITGTIRLTLQLAL